MWQQWRDEGEQKSHMQPLLNSLQPLVNKRVRQFQGVPIQREVLRAEANRKVIHGLRRYDPTKAQMHTFLTHELKGLRRYVQQHQNLSRIVEERANKIGDYQRSQATLSDTLDREPTTQEVADHMKFSVKQVTKLQSELREDLLASGALEDPFINETPRSREVLKLIPYELNPTEMQVFEYLTGYGGKTKVTSTSAIAKKLHWSDSKVSQVKKAISLKIKKYL
jgi:DNA-directed RNA polymerase specialized sigma subunit